jgi:hypothetical protein
VRSSFDRRVVPSRVLDFIRGCQNRVPSHLGGGAALAGAYLAHRTTGDVDLFCHDGAEMRLLVQVISDVAREAGLESVVLRDARSLVRARIFSADVSAELDVVFEPAPDLEPPPAPVEGIVVESLADLRASKLTCVLSRSEPRDLVDLYFLDQAGHPPERDLGLAIRKDAGIDPGVLAWVLSEFPVEPLPEMLTPLSKEQLRGFRDELAARLRRIATT